MSDSSQKSIGRNRTPRVQIEYDVELFGAERAVEIPFVMGVMADLKGNAPEDAPEPVDKRKFLEIDVDNFNDRLKAISPHVKTTVPDMLTGKDNLVVDLTFKSMDDFSPAAIANQVKELKKLLDARNQLDNLLTQMDGKSGAEDVISNLIKNDDLLQTLASAKKTDTSEEGETPDDQSSKQEE